ncbi:uncharacterized protein ora6 [Echeneis naucrates]|uniref:uncharacterized protein ora6 n=1 Tax=Echeneis naucrates TaxID=173247 RepID=UPI00111352A0|nr:uncharacterized protein LOC115037960 [Echeneis naucrates]
MDDFSVNLVALRLFISCTGLVGNVFLILSIIQSKFCRVKSFQLFLLGLAAANSENILIVNIYDIIILETSSTTTGTWLCSSLKFLTLFGEITSILFTVLISIFRYQKLRNGSKRVNLPICMDSIRSATMLSGICVILSFLVSLPVFIINQEVPAGNITQKTSGCPPDFFQCSDNYCPIGSRLYKYLFIVLCNLLPLVAITATGCLILTVLLSQRKMVTPAVSVSGLSQFSKKRKRLGVHRSTIGVLAAMGLFQVDWTLYLIFHLTFSPTDIPFWAEIEFFISISYTSISPYVYVIGNSLFSLKNCKKR